jgi:hypothetical protein
MRTEANAEREEGVKGVNRELRPARIDQLPRTPLLPYRPSFREYFRLARRRFIPRPPLEKHV